jgi:hypothetical protein
MPVQSNQDVVWAVDTIRANLKPVQRAMRYWKGDHPLNFATDKFRSTFGELFQELADNLCDDVVNEPTDRLQIDQWTSSTDGLAEAATEWWDDHRGQSRSGQVHQHGFRAGDGYVIVWDRNGDGNPRPYVQDPEQMAVRYSTEEPDQVEVAAKCWRDGKVYKLNLYYGPDPYREGDKRGRIEHFATRGVSSTTGDSMPQPSAFLPYQVAEEGDEAHVPPVEYHDRPRNPVFHFPNGSLGEAGLSVLHDVYPLQDALNKSLCDMLVAGEAYALPHRHAAGIQVMKDPVTGQEISPFKDGQNLWWTSNKDAKFGYFPAAEMKGFLEQQRGFRLEIARKGGLPAHTVDIGASGNAPSGLSLLIAEGKLIKRCLDRQRDWGDVWREMMAFVLHWLGKGDVTPKDLDIVWAPVPTRDEQALLEALVIKKELGLSDRAALREAGYDDKEIDGFEEEREEESAAKMDRAQSVLGGRLTPGTGGNLPAPPAPPAGAAEAAA